MENPKGSIFTWITVKIQPQQSTSWNTQNKNPIWENWQNMTFSQMSAFRKFDIVIIYLSQYEQYKINLTFV